MMKRKIVAALLFLAVLGSIFTGCNKEEEERTLELVRVSVLESGKGQDTYV